MRRTATLLILCALLAAPASAWAQAAPTATPAGIPTPAAGATVDPFNPIPPANPGETPTPAPISNPSDPGFGTRTLYAILGGVLLVLLIVGFVITRDARKLAPVADEARRKRDAELLANAEKQRKIRTKKDRRKAKAARAARKRTTRHR